MTTTFRIAWRNLWRNGRRTALALAAIGLSVTLVLAYFSILRAYGDWILATVTGPMLGHVQAHGAGWRRDRAMDRTIRQVGSVLDGLAHEPDVASASARVYAPALAALDEEGFAVVVIGIETEKESGAGRLLPPMAEPLGRGQVLMGRPLAELMGTSVGDALAIVGQGVDGSLANDLYTVAGIVNTPVDLVNRQGIVMGLADAQTLFAMPDEAHEILVHARNPTRVDDLRARVAALPGLVDAEVLDWRTLAPDLVSLLRLVEAAWVFILFLVFIAAAAGVANTMLMATFERTHEFGMLLALGTKPAQLVRMVLAEAVTLGLVGAAVGAAVGVALVAATHRSGIDWAALTGGGPTEISFAGLQWSLRLYPTLAVEDVVRVVGAVVLTSLLASVWPATRVARLQPVHALRG